MARNKSEKMAPDHDAMMAYLVALRHLVKLNLDAGQKDGFTGYLTTTPELREAALVYRETEDAWPANWDCAGDGSGGWQDCLECTEAYVKARLDAA